VPEGLIFGYPLKTNADGSVEIIQGIEINEFAQSKIDTTTEELLQEKEAVKGLLS